MSEAHHTPGPWSVVIEGECRPTKTAVVCRHAKGTTPVCSTKTLVFNNNCDEANARLIAAAPELVDALQAAKSDLEEVVLLYNTNALDVPASLYAKIAATDQMIQAVFAKAGVA